MKRKLLKTLLIAALLLCTDHLFAFTGGLETVAINPVKPELVVGGMMNNLVILDKTTFKVLRKIELGAECSEVEYTADGKVIVAHTDMSGVYFINSESGAILFHVDRAGTVAFSAKLDIVAIYNYGYESEIGIYSMTTGEKKLSLKMDEIEPEILGFDASRNQLLVYTDEMDDESEEKLKDEKILDEASFEHKIYLEKKYDQMKAMLHVYSLTDGALISSFNSWYSTSASFASVAFGDGTNYYVNGWDDNIMIFDQTGLKEVVETPNSFSYGAGFSIERTLILSDEYVYNYSTRTFSEFKIEKARSWSSGYLHDYAVDTDGTIYGVNSEYVIFSLSKTGTVLKAEFIDLPCHLVVSYIDPLKKSEVVTAIVTASGKPESEVLILVDAILKDEDLVVFTSTDYAKIAELDKLLDDGLDCSTKIKLE